MGSIDWHETRAHLQQLELRFHVSRPAREALEDGLRSNSVRRDCLNWRRACFWCKGQERERLFERYMMVAMATKEAKNAIVFLHFQIGRAHV